MMEFVGGECQRGNPLFILGYSGKVPAATGNEATKAFRVLPFQANLSRNLPFQAVLRRGINPMQAQKRKSKPKQAPQKTGGVEEKSHQRA